MRLGDWHGSEQACSCREMNESQEGKSLGKQWPAYLGKLSSFPEGPLGSLLSPESDSPAFG